MPVKHNGFTFYQPELNLTLNYSKVFILAKRKLLFLVILFITLVRCESTSCNNLKPKLNITSYRPIDQDIIMFFIFKKN